MIKIDEDILKDCAKSKSSAQKLLYEYCFRKWIPLCRRYHNNAEDARSSLNIAFLKILQNIGKLDIHSVNFDAWSKRIITNTLIDEYRKQKFQNDHYLKKETERELDYHSSTTENEGLHNLNYQTLLSLLDELPENTKIVFNLFVIEGYSHQEICEKLSIPLGTSKWQLSIAKKMLQEKLERLTNQTSKYEVYR